MSENIVKKSMRSRRDIVQLGNVSRRFGRHSDGWKVIVANLFYHTRQISGFPWVTLYLNSEVAVQRCYMTIIFGVELVKLGNK